MRIVSTLFLLLCGFFLIGQSSTITGRFLYSAQESFTYGIYDNPLMQASFPVQASVESDSQGYFELHIDLAKPEILHLQWGQDTYRCYIRPGDSLDLQILNRFNVQFAGTAALENTSLFAGEFHQSFYAGDPLEESLLALDTLAAKRRTVLAAYQQEAQNIDPDFVQYFTAEMIGHRFDQLNRVYYTHIKQQPENPILAIASNELLSLKAINETRSKAYLNAVYSYSENQLERSLALGEISRQDTLGQWQMRRRWSEEWTLGHPQLRKEIAFIHLYLQLWRMEGRRDLEAIKEEWNVLKKNWPTSPLHALITKLHDEKTMELKLLDIKDLAIQDALGETSLLSEHGSYPKVVMLISSKDSTYADQLNFFSSIFSPLLKKGQLLAINLSQETMEVRKTPSILKDNVDYAYLTKTAAATFLLDYSSDQLPIYLYFKAPFEPVRASYQLNQAFMQEVYGMDTRP